jgi:hypothetical protein
MDSYTYLEPIRTLLAKAETLKAETNTSFTATLCVWALITFLNMRVWWVGDE